MKNTRYRFFAWADRKTNFVVQELTWSWNYTPYGHSQKQIPCDVYTFIQQVLLILTPIYYQPPHLLYTAYLKFLKGKFVVGKIDSPVHD